MLRFSDEKRLCAPRAAALIALEGAICLMEAPHLRCRAFVRTRSRTVLHESMNFQILHITA